MKWLSRERSQRITARLREIEDRHWESRPMYGGSESRLLVQNSSGKVLIEILHGSAPDDLWSVYKNGADYGTYITEDQAKKFAESLV